MRDTKKNMGSFAPAKLQAISLRLIAIIALVAVIGFGVAACNKGGGGKISGVYKNDAPNMDLIYTFTGNKVTAATAGSVWAEGTFTTSGDEITMTFDGSEVKTKYSLEGKKLTIGEGAGLGVYTKQ